MVLENQTVHGQPLNLPFIAPGSVWVVLSVVPVERICSAAATHRKRPTNMHKNPASSSASADVT